MQNVILASAGKSWAVQRVCGCCLSPTLNAEAEAICSESVPALAKAVGLEYVVVQVVGKSKESEGKLEGNDSYAYMMRFGLTSFSSDKRAFVLIMILQLYTTLGRSQSPHQPLNVCFPTQCISLEAHDADYGGLLSIRTTHKARPLGTVYPNQRRVFSLFFPTTSAGMERCIRQQNSFGD